MTLLRAGRLLLDGGGMFGVIPKTLWSRLIEPDEKNRIELAHNCLLLERVDDAPGAASAAGPAADGPRRVIVETGTGDKLGGKMRAIFGLEDRTVETALIEQGHDPSEIDDVVVSHLHFDHAGGLTRRVRAGERADWTAGPGEASGDEPGVKLTFPNARVHVQAREWADALANDAVMTKTYYRDHLEPLRVPLADGGDRLATVDSPPPFSPGVIPHREETPGTSVQERMTEILPGIFVFRVPGHTWGQQAVLFHDEDHRPIVFTPDLLPTAHHVGAAYSLAYDVEPYTSMVTKRWFLEEAVAGGWVLMLDHEAETPLVRVEPDGSGWFRLEAVSSTG